MEYRFHLEKYKNSSSKHVCPKCGHKGCFVRYIDTAGEITFGQVGKNGVPIVENVPIRMRVVYNGKRETMFFIRS